MTPGPMDKARKALASASIRLNAGDTDGATNRAYYAMFDAAIAALTMISASAQVLTGALAAGRPNSRPSATRPSSNSAPSARSPRLS